MWSATETRFKRPAARSARSNRGRTKLRVVAVSGEFGALARDLPIRETLLLAIEEGRLDDLPGVPFRTGLVRSYADRLGLDGAAMAARLRPATGP